MTLPDQPPGGLSSYELQLHELECAGGLEGGAQPLFRSKHQGIVARRGEQDESGADQPW